jgi:hypothetical protein
VGYVEGHELRAVRKTDNGEQAMLKLTEAAGSHLAGILHKRDCADNVAVRIVPRNSRWALSLDKRKTGDATLKHEGRTVLLIGPDAAEQLDGRTVHVRRTKAGKKLCHGKKGRRSA